MKRSSWLKLICMLLVLSVLPAMSVGADETKPIDLMYTTFFTPKHEQTLLIKEWGSEIEKRTNGAVHFSYYPGDYLQGDNIYEGVVLGATDIGMSVFSYNIKRFPAMEAVDLPLGYPSAKVATSVINDFYNKYHPKELDNTKILYLHAHGPGMLHSKAPVYTLKDFKGMRIRSTVFTSALTKALGAIPVVKPQGFTRVLLQDGYVGATWGPLEVLTGWNLAEQIKYSIWCKRIGYTTGFYVAMNLKKWDALTKDVQRVFEEVSAEWVPKHALAWDEADSRAREYSLSLGNKVVVLDEEKSSLWQKAAQPVIDDYEKRIEKKGLPGKEYVATVKELIQKAGE